MERVRLAALATGIAATAGLSIAYLFFSGGIVTPGYCPLEFGVHPLNTTAGWFYTVVGLKGEPHPLSMYNVTVFVYSDASSGDQDRIVEYQGSLVGLLGASGNSSFEDRGSVAGYLDAGGDYFWARTWRNLEVYREGRLVGGTVGCI